MPRFVSPYHDMAERLFVNSVVDPSTGCWIWLGKRHRGYGYLTVRQPGKRFPVKRRAHRVSYETFIGPIPDGMELDHECVESLCIHPNHVRPVTCQANIALRDARRGR